MKLSDSMFWWPPSFAGGVCQGRLESVSCLDGHLLTLSLTESNKMKAEKTDNADNSSVNSSVSSLAAPAASREATLAAVVVATDALLETAMLDFDNAAAVSEQLMNGGLPPMGVPLGSDHPHIIAFLINTSFDGK